VRRGIRTEVDIHKKATATGSPAGPDGHGELSGPPQTLLGREHDQPRSTCQADRRSRPLARRADRMARPARVRIRSRKPWVFARRRLFGW
jgi:hypothetical protein